MASFTILAIKSGTHSHKICHPNEHPRMSQKFIRPTTDDIMKSLMPMTRVGSLGHLSSLTRSSWSFRCTGSDSMRFGSSSSTHGIADLADSPDGHSQGSQDRLCSSSSQFGGIHLCGLHLLAKAALARRECFVVQYCRKQVQSSTIRQSTKRWEPGPTLTGTRMALARPSCAQYNVRV